MRTSLVCITIMSVCAIFLSCNKSEDSSVALGIAVPPGMAIVTGGTFQMGGGSGLNNDEQPVHAVTVTSFYLDANEVTVAQYRAFSTATSRTMPASPSWGFSDDNPIVSVNWNDATAYAQWAGKRLLTEAEWEYAARGGNKSHAYTYSGSSSIGDVGWYDVNAGKRTHAVGTKTPNELGLFDMSGNVYEWCSDWYDSGYYRLSPSVDPKGPSSGIGRIVRGGDWSDPADASRVGRRLGVPPTYITNLFGFRCAKDF